MKEVDLRTAWSSLDDQSWCGSRKECIQVHKLKGMTANTVKRATSARDSGVVPDILMDTVEMAKWNTRTYHMDRSSDV